jgi:hypothetical protein
LRRPAAAEGGHRSTIHLDGYGEVFDYQGVHFDSPRAIRESRKSQTLFLRISPLLDLDQGKVHATRCRRRSRSHNQLKIFNFDSDQYRLVDRYRAAAGGSDPIPRLALLVRLRHMRSANVSEVCTTFSRVRIRSKPDDTQSVADSLTLPRYC